MRSRSKPATIRLSESQGHRCAICSTAINPLAYSDDNDVACTAKIDNTIKRSYDNCVALCAKCCGKTGNATLAQVYEAHINGYKKEPKPRVIYPDSIKMIKHHVREILKDTDLVTTDIFVPNNFQYMPPEYAQKAAETIAQRQCSIQERIGNKNNKNNKSFQRRSFKRLLLEAQNHRCAYCGDHLSVDDITNPDYATWEHVIALKDGGKDNLQNLVMACVTCNCTRNEMNLTAEEFFERVVADPEMIKEKKHKYRTIVFPKNNKNPEKKATRRKRDQPTFPLYG